MNIFIDYQNKILSCVKKLSKQKIIKIPTNFKNITVELPPKNQNADLSSNASLILSKLNNCPPRELAELLKKELLNHFKEFEKIEIAGPGFINISFKKSFWKKHLNKVIELKSKYGSNNANKKKYNIEFVSANPTGPLHVGHCRGAILGDTLSNLLLFNGNKVTKEYYVNDYGEQIKKFIDSVYYRILEILNNKPFPANRDLYPGDYIIDIAKIIIKKKNNKKF